MSATRFCNADKEGLINHMTPDRITKFAEYPFTKKENAELYLSTMPKAVRDALETINDYGCKRFLQETKHSVTVKLPTSYIDNAKPLIQYLTLDIPDGMSLPEKGHFKEPDQVLAPDSPYMPELTAFLKQYLTLRGQMLAAQHIAQAYVPFANTPGQFKFLFPELVDVLESGQKSTILKARASSRIPRGVSPEGLSRLRKVGPALADVLARNALAKIVDSLPIRVGTNCAMDNSLLDMQLKRWGFREDVPHMEEV